MSITVMIANSGPEDEGALRYASGLSKRLGVPLEAVSSMPDPATAFVYATSEYAVGVGAVAVKRVREAQDKTVEEITDMFGRICADLAISPEKAEYRHLVATPEATAGHAAILTDGIVFPRSAGRADHALTRAFESVLIDCRLPVILSGPPEQKQGPVLIAWDGSAEAARSVMLHEGLIRCHRHAVIAQNPDDLKPEQTGSAADTRRLAKWLAVRDVSSEISTFTGKVAEGLQQIARDTQADLIVSGAYGHSRMGEFLFGGATRSLLHCDETPALALTH